MDSKNFKLSIIIPVYNTEKYLKRCLDSAINAVTPITDQVEILIINDGSTDESEKIIQKYCECNSFIKYFKKENGGLSDVKNYGLKRATGEYVIFLDSDDYVEKEMYIDMLEIAQRENSDIVVCDIRLAYDDSLKDSEWPCTVESRNDVFSKIIDMSMMPASWNKIIRRELYDGMQFPVGINNEDVAVTPIVLARAKKISVINKPYYNYYQREGSIQNSEFSEKRFVILNTVKMCIDQFNKIDPVKAEKIKGSLYMHQVLSMALYPIRKQKFKLRYHLLKKYMEKVRMDFPDLWENQEIKESLQWEGRRMRYFRKISYGLLKNRLYLMTSLFWTVCNYSLKIYNNRNKR